MSSNSVIQSGEADPVSLAPHPQPPVEKQKNTLATVALITAAIGFIFACIPGALIVGWILLPISFILAIVSLFMKGRKGFGIAALIISIVGTIVAVLVFMFAVGSAIDESFSGGDISAEQPVEDEAQAFVAGQDDVGTRPNPHPIGTAITQGDWTVTVNSTTLDATEAVLAANMFNDPPAEGNVYLMANITATYNGDDQQGETPWVTLQYVTGGGNTISSSDAMIVEPESFDSLSPLYPGASTTGNIAFEVDAATANEGAYALSPSMFGDRIFVSVQ